MIKPTVFVVGDILIDRYVSGFASHVSPEAAAMVFVQEGTTHRAGGMWNTAANLIASESVEAYVFGVAGADNGIWKVVESETFGPGCSTVFEKNDRTTQIKTRFLAQHGVQLLRVDTPKDGPIGASTVQRMIKEMELVGTPDLILISDYGCGVVTRGLMSRLYDAFPNAVTVVDPYPTTDPHVYALVDVITPNSMEYGLLDRGCAEGSLTGLVKIVVETRGGLPTRVHQRGKEPFEVPVPHRDMTDPCGAGDAFVAYLVGELANGSPIMQAVITANHAGACAVSRRGVVQVQPSEVSASMGVVEHG